jgi:hypothetical protein
MIDRIFPKQAGNTYQGHPIAKWVLVVLTTKALVAGLIHMFSQDGGAQSIASITLDNFTKDAAGTVITIFALWGLSQFLIGLISVVVLWRYQALIPMMYLIFLIEYTMRFAMPLFTPGVASVNTPPGAVLDHAILPLTAIMTVLAVRGRQTDTQTAPGSVSLQ